MGTVSIGKDNFEIHSVDQALQIIKNAMSDEKEIWISGDNDYPSMAICLNGEYAVERRNLSGVDDEFFSDVFDEAATDYERSDALLAG